MNIQNALKYLILLVATANLVACGATKVESGSGSGNFGSYRDGPPPIPGDENPLAGYDQRVTACTLIDPDQNNLALKADARTVVNTFVDRCSNQVVNNQEDPNSLAISIDKVNHLTSDSDTIMNIFGWSEDNSIKAYTSALYFMIQQRGTGIILRDSDNNTHFNYLNVNRIEDIIDHNGLLNVSKTNFLQNVLIIINDERMGDRVDDCGAYKLKALSLRLYDSANNYQQLGLSEFLIPKYYIHPDTYAVVKANEPILRSIHPLAGNPSAVDSYLQEAGSRCL